MHVKKNNIECAFNIVTTGDNPICMDKTSMDALYKFAKNIKKMDVSSPSDAIDKLKNDSGCKTESCLLNKSDIRNVIGVENAETQLNTRFKPIGPYEGSDWFSNEHIDGVLRQMYKEYKTKGFKHIPFQMRDFESTHGELSKVDFVEEYNSGTKSIGVVFNTDYSSGRGKHWYSIFIDMRNEPITIEYFNSSGEDPQDEIRSWMKKTKHNMEKELGKKVDDVIVSKIQHQRDNHSCGSYSIYYIVSRLEDVPYMVFSKKRIPDELMHKFRFSLFRKEK